MNIVPVRVTQNAYILVNVANASTRGVVLSLATHNPKVFKTYKGALVEACTCKGSKLLVSTMSLESFVIAFQEFQRKLQAPIIEASEKEVMRAYLASLPVVQDEDEEEEHGEDYYGMDFDD